MSILEVQNVANKVEGYLTDKEGKFLYEVAADCINPIVEIGSWKGRSTVWLAYGCKDGKHARVYAVDPHTGSPELPKGHTFKEFKKNLKNAGIEERVKPIVKTSEEAAKNFSQKADFIFVDGAHDLASVKQDFDNWFPKLFNGGIMAFHDTAFYYGPRTVARNMFKSDYFRNVGFCDSIAFGEKCLKNNFFDRLRNHWMLFLMDCVSTKKRSGAFVKKKCVEFAKIFFKNKMFDKAFRRPYCFAEPDSMQVEVTNRCNLRCVMCERSYLKEKPKDMSFREFKKVFDNSPSVRRINFTGVGEILLNKDFFKMIKYAKKRDCEVCLTTNGMLLNKANAKKLVKLKVDAVAVSIDGTTAKTYESIRRGADFNIVTENVVRLVKMRENKKPKVSMAFVVLPENTKEVGFAGDLAIALGVDNLYFEGLLEFKESGIKTADIDKESLELFLSYAKKVASCHGITVANLSSLTRPFSGLCFIPWNIFYVDCYGKILPCCFVTQRNNIKLRESFIMADGLKVSVKDFWNNEKYKNLRKGILECKPVLGCAGCVRK